MQLHNRLSSEQICRVLKGYCDGLIDYNQAIDLLGLKRTQFFAWVKTYRADPKTFRVGYHRSSPKQVSSDTENLIERYLKEDAALITNPQVPVYRYNYTALKDRLQRENRIKVSVPTIISRAKQHGCYQAKKKLKAAHDRVVSTTAPGALVQHDSSFHLWSPLAPDLTKWYLITSIDDYSRRLLYSYLVESETTWSHIEAARDVSLKYGVPLEWYTDQLRIFRYVSHGKSIWINQSVETDGVNPQWKECVLRTGSQVIHALSPQAKGKIERPYQWLQDRVVRICMQEKVTNIRDANQIIRQETERYNNHQVHSTTREVPVIRYEKAVAGGQSLFKKFIVPRPYTHLDDIFCLTEIRTTNTYRKISLWNTEIRLDSVPKCEEVSVHIAPQLKSNTIHIRIWWQDRLVFRTIYPRDQFPKVRF